MKNLWKLLPAMGLALLCMSCDDFLDDDDLSPGDLPTVVTDYIKNDYSGYDIDDIDTEDFCFQDQRVFEVELEDGPGPDIDLYFSLDGDFLFSGVEIDEVDLPAAVLQSVAANFAGYSIDNDDDDDLERLTFEDGTVQYMVELEAGNKDDLEVIFAEDGSVICQKKDDDDDD